MTSVLGTITSQTVQSDEEYQETTSKTAFESQEQELNLRLKLGLKQKQCQMSQ